MTTFHLLRILTAGKMRARLVETLPLFTSRKCYQQLTTPRELSVRPTVQVGFLLEKTMMSRMEKNAQVGDLVQQRQNARIELEHLKLKGKKIAAAYSAFGSNQDRWCVEAPAATDVFLRYPKGPESDHPSPLLGHAQLTEHVREVIAAEAVLANIKVQLANLGITD